MLTPDQTAKHEQALPLIDAMIKSQTFAYKLELCEYLNITNTEELVPKLADLCAKSSLTPTDFVDLLRDKERTRDLFKQASKLQEISRSTREGHFDMPLANVNTHALDMASMAAAAAASPDSPYRLDKEIQDDRAPLLAAATSDIFLSKLNFFVKSNNAVGATSNIAVDANIKDSCGYLDKKQPTSSDKWKSFQNDKETALLEAVNKLADISSALNQQVQMQADEITRLRAIIEQQNQTIDSLRSQVDHQASERAFNGRQ